MKTRKATGLLLLLLCFIAVSLVSLGVPPVAASPDPVYIITPHWSGIYSLIETAFETKYPTIDAVFTTMGTPLAFAHLRDTKANPDMDVIWGGGLDKFEVAKDEGLITPYMLPSEIDANISASLFGLPLKDPDNYFYGSALSGFGIMYHPTYLTQYGLMVPTDWTDLANPEYFGHIVMSTPSRSSSTLMIVETILQALGWEEGWELLYTIGANVGEFSEKSGYVPAEVSAGEYGVGLVIDFYSFSSKAAGYPVEFVYPAGNTVINPDCVALVANGPNPENGKKFIDFVLSYEGQKLLFDPVIYRMPVRQDVYAEAPTGYFDPFDTEMTVIEYNSTLGELRTDLLELLFDDVITHRHAELVAAWSAIMTANATANSAEAEGYDVSAIRTMIDEAITLMSTPPLNETEMTTLGQEYKAATPDDREDLVAKYKAEWDGYAVHAFASAKMKAEDAQSLLWTYVIRNMRESITIIRYIAIALAVIIPMICVVVYHVLVVRRIT